MNATTHIRRGPSAGWIVLILVSFLGVGLLLYFTRSGLAIRGDSVRYVMGARNLLAGNGFSRTSGGGELYPETGFAPFASFVLAGMGFVGLDMFKGAHVLNLALFALNIFLVGWMLWRFTSSWIAAGAGSLLTAIAPNVLEWHGWLMSEPLFISLTLLSLLFLVRFIDSGRPAWLGLAGGLAGLASITRYAGLSLVPAGVLTIMTIGHGSRRMRLAHATGFGVLAAGPFLLWMVRNQLAGGPGFANRQLILHKIRPDLLRHYLFEAASWVVPEQIQVHRLIRAAVAVAVTGLGPLAFVVREWRNRDAGGTQGANGFRALPWACLYLVPSYVALLFINSLLLDAGTTLSAVSRYLAPLFVVLALLEVSVYADWIRRAARPRTYAALAVSLAAVLIGLYAEQSMALASRSTAALGFTDIRERWGDVVSDVRALDPSRPIITNNPEMVYFLVGRPAYILPIMFDVYRQQERSDFEQQLELTSQRLREGAVLVVFEPPKEQEADVISRLRVVPIRKYLEVTLYGYLP